MNFPTDFIEFCTSLGLKLTSMRKEVLYCLWNANKPLKAYDILSILHQTHISSQPPSVYRALDFFSARGIVHKIESIQSYTLCSAPINHLQPELLMVCNNCHAVVEVYDPVVQARFLELAHKQQFKLKQDIIELKGTCGLCG